ncbi:MAG: TonB-dependent receptor [Caulobacterales bacterium]|nr:TonB-dependent receptor [Caulobacterales bacterium]
MREDDGNLIYLGGDDSRQANDLNYDVLDFVAKAFYQLGNHSLSAGFERQEVDIFNLFVQHVQGQIEFNSIADFENGIFDDYDYANAPSLNPDDAAANWGYAVNAIYGQDEWTVGDFTFTAGLRYDYYTSDDTPPENPDFVADYGFSNALNIDGLGLLQPRLGVQWEATDALTVRAGVGRFSGGNPNVWLSNNYSANNVTQFTVNERDLPDGLRSLADLTFILAEEGTPGGAGWGVPQELVELVEAGEGGNFEINALDPDFEIPSEWKISLGATFLADVPIGGFLGGEYMLTGDVILTRGQNSAGIERLDLVEVEPVVGGLLPQFESPTTDAFLLTNVEGTESLNITVGASKSYDSGVDWTFGYSYTDAQDEQPMTSAVAFSNYNSRAFVNPNGDGLSTSNYNIKHRATLGVTYETNFVADFATRFGLTGIVNQGRPFSYTFTESNALFDFKPFLSDNVVQLYVPTGPDDPNVIFGPDFDQDAFFAFVNEVGLDEYAGGFAERNAFESDWWVKFDLKLEQEFPGVRPGHRSAAFVIIDNVGNLINDEWGVLNEASFPRLTGVVDAGLSEDKSQFVFNEFIDTPSQSVVGDSSLWSIRLGVRYQF